MSAQNFSSPTHGAELRLRVARPSDAERIGHLMERAIAELQSDVLSPSQVEASRMGMGLDTQLIADGTYFVVEAGEAMAGCGGWSRRATLYGGNHSGGRDARLLDPATERARIRAMYTHPDFVRRGVGRLILEAGEAAARAEGFRAAEMAATLAGKPFYERCGYAVERAFDDMQGDVAVPLFVMARTL